MSPKRDSILSFFCKSGPQLWLGGIFILGFLLRFFVWYCDPIITRDSYWYILKAELMYGNGSIETTYEISSLSWGPPLLFFAMKSLMTFGLSAETAGVVLNLFFGSCIPIITWGIALEITQNQKIAIASALLIAVHPKMVKLSTQILRDMPYLFLIGLVLYFFLAGLRRQRCWCWFGCGTVLAFALMTRIESFELAPLIPLSFCIMVITKKMSWRQAARGFSICCVCTALSFLFLIDIMQCKETIVQNYSSLITGKIKGIELPFSEEE